MTSKENITEKSSKSKKNDFQEKKNENEDSVNEEEEEELDEYDKKEKEYIAQIEQLSNELQIEKNITNSIQKDPVQEEIISKLKDELNEKQIKFHQLKTTNEKQKKAIEQLSKEINKTFLKNNNKNNNLIDNNNNINKKNNLDSSKNKEEPINIILKIKEKQLNEALFQLENLRKKNDEMKLILEKSNDDYNKKRELIDLGKEKEEKISSLNFELKMLNKEMENHNKCLNEQKECLNVLEKLKKEMNEEKKENIELKEKIKENEKKLHFLVFGDLENKIKKKNNSEINETSYKNIKKKNSSPLKNSKVNNSILTESFVNKLKEAINDNEEYESLINKIKNLENGRNKLEKKHKNELNLIGEQINNLDIQYNFLDNKGKENDIENRILNFKVNELKNEQKINQKKLIHSQRQLDFLINKNKEKDQEIKLLNVHLNYFKNFIKYGNVNQVDIEVDKYINKLKKEKEKEDKINNIVSKEEQEVQANFEDSEEDN